MIVEPRSINCLYSKTAPYGTRILPIMPVGRADKGIVLHDGLRTPPKGRHMTKTCEQSIVLFGTTEPAIQKNMQFDSPYRRYSLIQSR